MYWFCGYWCFAENQYRKVIGFAKNSKEGYGYYGSSLVFSTITSSNLLTYDISGNQSINVQNFSSGGVLKKRCILRQNI